MYVPCIRTNMWDDGETCAQDMIQPRGLQRVTVRCSALQCVAVCCSVLQCVAVCCSALLYDINERKKQIWGGYDE